MLPGRLLLLSLTPSMLIVAWWVHKAQWFWRHNPDLEFGWIVVLLSGYLLFEAWETKPVPRFQGSWVGVVVASTGFGFLFLTQIYQAAYGLTAASMSGLAIGGLLVVVGNLEFVFGLPGIKHFVFGFIFLLIAFPIPSLIYAPIVSGLQSQVASVNVEMLNLIGIPAQRIGSLIQLPNGTVGVDEACSGVRSIQSTVMATLFVGYLSLHLLGLRLVLLGLGIAFAIVGNLIRSLCLSYVANASGVEAIERFHDSAGWSILLFTVAGVSASAWGLHRLELRVERSIGPVRPTTEPKSA